MNKSRFVLAGAHSGVGKTSVSAGIMSALTKRGLTVQPWKVGPDYIDPAFHSFVTGRKSRNLDSWLLDETTVKRLFVKNAPDGGSGVSVIEGVMGLFDGHIADNSGSSAHVAQILGAPTVLIVSGASIARSIAALVHGYNTFQPGFSLSGVIVNMVSGESHYQLLKSFIENEAGVKCFGYLEKNPEAVLESRHLGLVPSVEVANLAERLDKLAAAVEKTIDLDGLLELAGTAPELEGPPVPEAPCSIDRPKVRVGLALDSAFNFYYQDSLDLLTEMGAELVPFSPVEDRHLPPDLCGLYFGGGFPEIFADRLEANSELRQEIRRLLEKGFPAYAECGGLMYLGKSLSDLEGRQFEMVGFFEHKTEMTRKLQNFGYAEVTFDQNTVLGPAGTKIRGHEFHHSRIADNEPEYVMSVRKSEKRHWPGGVCRLNTLAAYPHLHFHANPEVAGHFLSRCRDYCAGRISDKI